MEIKNTVKKSFRVAAGLDGGTSEACRATLSKCSTKGGWWGLMVVGQSEALAERHDPNFGVVGRG